MPKIQIDGHIYDFTGYLQNHPGEKPQKDSSISNYANKDATERFNQCHNKKNRWEIARNVLEKARTDGEYQGLIYIGPSLN